MKLTRLALALSVLCTAACDPMIFRGLALSPTPTIGTTRDTLALDILAEVVNEYHMEPMAHFEACYTGRNGVSLCGQHVGSEFQFVMSKSGFKWTPFADSVQQTLSSAVRAAFGDAVRECEVEYVESSRVMGCTPVQQDSVR
jgi:hypothetical protein